MDDDREFTIDPDRAPITMALAMRYEMMHGEISSAAPEERSRLALDEMYSFLGDVLIAIHQLETGEPPAPVVPEGP